MKLIFRSMARYKKPIAIAILIKLFGTIFELLLPYILEHIIDEVVPAGDLVLVLSWGLAMFVSAVLCRTFNVMANRKSVDNAHRISYEIRQALFEKTINLSGETFDTFGLPSLISRMTSDSYNVQTVVQQLQTLCVRAPMMLFGGIVVSLFMDWELAMILVVLMPVLLLIILLVVRKGIPMFTVVQQKLDVVVRVMRENITGIRVVKALSKESYEKKRFGAANEDMTSQDIKAASIMAIPGPLMQLFLNVGLTVVVLFGAFRVNAGHMRPGVILAFLTYFNMIAMGVMGLTRIFMTISKASASADRIDEVLQCVEPEPKRAAISEHVADNAANEVAQDPADEEAFIVFDHVNFSYGEGSADHEGFMGLEREKALSDITFKIRKGESLGIIGPTGCGKTTIVNLLMHFYEADEGKITVDGRDVASYEKDELRRKFGTVFQNDRIFQDTLKENINFGRNVSEEAMWAAAHDAQVADYIETLPEGLSYEAAIAGANLSGGQKQRILVARALAADPEILILDDSSSALDYKTDAAMRRAIAKHHPDTTTIMIAQRVSSVMNMTQILVMEDGKAIGLGDHESLLATCETYREVYEVQMGALGAAAAEGR